MMSLKRQWRRLQSSMHNHSRFELSSAVDSEEELVFFFIRFCYVMIVHGLIDTTLLQIIFNTLRKSSQEETPMPTCFYLVIAYVKTFDVVMLDSQKVLAASLAEKLLVASREWFLEYLEESISHDFGLKSEGSSEAACLLGQWFLLEHVNSAVASS